MPTPPVIDIESLLGPIPGADSSGVSLPFVLRERLDLARKAVDPNDFDKRDPMRPTEAKPADWGGIIALTGETLARSSKDLILVARLIEALTQRHGFGGLRDGLRLLRRLVVEAWDRVRPVIEEPDDLEARAAAVHWLDDADRGARFPATIRNARLLDAPSGPVSWIVWSLSKSDKPIIKADEFDKAVAATPREACQAVADDLDEIQAELQLLLEAMADKMGPATPGLGQVRQAVGECRTLAHQILERKGPGPVVVPPVGEEDVGAGAETADGDATGSPAAATTTTGKITNRVQAYQRLIEVADALQQLEPHSPIPHVIRRAIALGQLSFPELMKELITDIAVLDEMSRNLGIKELQKDNAG